MGKATRVARVFQTKANSLRGFFERLIKTQRELPSCVSTLVVDIREAFLEEIRPMGIRASLMRIYARIVLSRTA